LDRILRANGAGDSRNGHQQAHSLLVDATEKSRGNGFRHRPIAGSSRLQPESITLAARSVVGALGARCDRSALSSDSGLDGNSRNNEQRDESR